MSAKFVMFKDRATKFRFRLVAPNGEIIAASEAYESKASCLNGIKSIQKNAPIAKIEDDTAAKKPAAKEPAAKAPAAKAPAKKAAAKKAAAKKPAAKKAPAAKPALKKAAPKKPEVKKPEVKVPEVKPPEPKPPVVPEAAPEQKPV